MLHNYKYGFTYKGFKFGWRDKKLYRLPSIVNNRFYPIKELSEIMIHNKVGYRIVRDKKTIEQLKEITVQIDYDHVTVSDKDCPF